MTTITVKTRLTSALHQRYPRNKLFSMEINLDTKTARVRYKNQWYKVDNYSLPSAGGTYISTLKDALPGNIYSTEYAILMGAPWTEDYSSKRMLVQHRNRLKPDSSSIIFWHTENGKRSRKRVYGKVVEVNNFKMFVPRLKEVV
jgi:hypothetical protein